MHVNGVSDDEHSTATTPVLVATTLLTVVVGTVLWRSKFHHNLSFASLKSHCASSELPSSQKVAPEPPKAAARPKERRKRRKDPLKDILKGNKRGKATLVKLSKVLDTHSSSTNTPSEYVRSTSVSTSSRSVSTASSSRTRDDADDADVPSSSRDFGCPVHSVSYTSSSIDSRDDEEDDRTPPALDDVPDFPPPPASPANSNSTHTSQCSIPSLADSSSSSSSMDTVRTEELDADPYFAPYQDGELEDADALPQFPLEPTLRAQPIAGPSKICASDRKSPPLTSSRSGSPPLQSQLASLRRALEAARVREETSRRNIERYGKELEMMRWERESWRQREAELHSQMQQMQAYMAALFSTPSPVTPLFAYPSPTYYPMHHHAYSASPSPSGSPNDRGRRRTRLDEDVGVSEALADAILKRPGTINLGRREEERHESPSPHLQDTVEELTFPSLYPHPHAKYGPQPQ